MLMPEQIPDLVTTTLSHMDRLKFTQIATDLQRYIALSEIMKKERVSFDGGSEIEWPMMVSYFDSARNTGLYAEDVTGTADAMKKPKIPWKKTTSSWIYDTAEISMNAARPSKIVDFLQTKRVQAFIAKAVIMENNFWGKPEDENDVFTPFGIHYWLTSGAAGFNGGDPIGFPLGRAGFKTADYPNWANRTDRYTAISDNDLVDKMRSASDYSFFNSPVAGMHQELNTGNRNGIYTTHNVYRPLCSLLRAANENVGRELDKFDHVLFQGNTVRWVPYLQANYPKDPVIGINWGVFKVVFLEGWVDVTHSPKQAPKQHTVIEIFNDSIYNFRCTDLRLNWYIEKE